VPKNEDKLIKKEQEYIDILNNNGQVIIEDEKELKKISKKLEKIYGLVNPSVIKDS
jgi:hypothetical protein